jgi:pyrimidine deaminase RibD-like protein
MGIAMIVTLELIAELHKRCSKISEAGRAFFSKASDDIEGRSYGLSAREAMSVEILGHAEKLRIEVRDLTVRLLDAAKSSPLMSREDISDATTAMKTALAALRIKDYQRWDTEVLNDEDVVLGVRQGGQVEQNTDLRSALRRFEEAMQKLTDLAALLVPGESVTLIGEDYEFGRMAVEQARLSISEDDRPHPLVGAVVVKDGRVLAMAHRGEMAGNHAEYIALERKSADVGLTDCTVYTTLEPCTTRTHPKVPCCDRLIERKIARVVIGMLDPNPDIRGRGMWKLQEANVAVEVFPHDLTREIQELNRNFIRWCQVTDKGGQEVKKQLVVFMNEGQRIRNSIEYNNPASVSEKKEWERRVELFLTAKLDESYAVQFRIPTREVTVYPNGMESSMRVPWADLTAKLAVLSDFISKLRH